MTMKILLTLLLWALLLVVCWPVALGVVILWPLLVLFSIPCRLIGTLMNAMLALVKARLSLPARILGYRE